METMKAFVRSYTYTSVVCLYTATAEVRQARTLREALSLGSDQRTAAKLVLACLGEIDFLTPGAFYDHAYPNSKTEDRLIEGQSRMSFPVKFVVDACDRLVSDEVEHCLCSAAGRLFVKQRKSPAARCCWLETRA